jgi:hypothetical protein
VHTETRNAHACGRRRGDMFVGMHPPRANVSGGPVCRYGQARASTGGQREGAGSEHASLIDGEVRRAATKVSIANISDGGSTGWRK